MFTLEWISIQFLSACEPEKERLLRNKKIYYRFLENILNHLIADITEEAEYCSMLADVMLGWSLSTEPHLSLNEQSVTACWILLKNMKRMKNGSWCLGGEWQILVTAQRPRDSSHPRNFERVPDAFCLNFLPRLR